jgi:hypothetical protein
VAGVRGVEVGVPGAIRRTGFAVVPKGIARAELPLEFGGGTFLAVSRNSLARVRGDLPLQREDWTHRYGPGRCQALQPG